MAAAGAESSEKKDTETTPAVRPGTQRTLEAIDTVRKRTDLTAKALGGLGTTAVTAVGIARIGDLFPVPPNARSWIWFLLALVGFAAVASAVLIVTYRLWLVHQPIFMRTDPETMHALGDIDAAELEMVRAIYDESADLNRVYSLAAYEASAHRLTRVAARTRDDGERERLKEMIAEINGDIAAVQTRAALWLLRQRSSKAIRAKGAVGAYALLVGGILVFALGTDYVSSERTERVTIAKSCADARKAGARPDIVPDICGADPKVSPPAQSSPAQERGTAAGALVAPLSACLERVDAGRAPPGSCDPIVDAIAALLPTP
jgi:hypothetical protein